jgi:hypothetical protein
MVWAIVGLRFRLGFGVAGSSSLTARLYGRRRRARSAFAFRQSVRARLAIAAESAKPLSGDCLTAMSGDVAQDRAKAELKARAPSRALATWWEVRPD